MIDHVRYWANESPSDDAALAPDGHNIEVVCHAEG